MCHKLYTGHFFTLCLTVLTLTSYFKQPRVPQAAKVRDLLREVLNKRPIREPCNGKKKTGRAKR